jgi:hypothetical protein
MPTLVPTFVLQVIEPVLYPLPARAGQLLVVWPGHPTHTVTVWERNLSRVVRHGYVSDGALYGPILCLCDDGALAFLTPADAQRAQQLAS